MPIQHKSINDPNIHEPKGISTATAGQSYISDGLGSGSWQQVELPAFGGMSITSNTTNFTVTAASDPTLKTSSDYLLLTGAGAPWLVNNGYGNVTFDTNKLTAPVTGIYRVSASVTVSAYPSASAKVGLRYRINGATFSNRGPIIKATATDDSRQLVINEFVLLNAGHSIQLYVASTAAGNIKIDDASFNIELLHKVG